MSTAVFLSDLRRQGIRVSADGDRLRCSALSGVLTPAIAAELQRRKQEILRWLGAAHTIAYQSAIVPLQARGWKPAVFGVAGHNGDVFSYRGFAEALGTEQPFFGLQPPGHEAGSTPLDRIELLAAHFAAQIVAFRPRGPHIIAGYCAGGCVAIELACQLQERGIDIGSVALFGCPPPPAFRWFGRMDRRVRAHVRTFAALETLPARGRYVADFARRRTLRADPPAIDVDPILIRRTALEHATLAAVRRFRPRRFAGRLNFFSPSRAWAAAGFRQRSWRRFAGDMREYTGPDDCQLENMLRAPYAAVFAGLLADAALGLTPGNAIPAPDFEEGLTFLKQPIEERHES